VTAALCGSAAADALGIRVLGLHDVPLATEPIREHPIEHSGRSD